MLIISLYVTDAPSTSQNARRLHNDLNVTIQDQENQDPKVQIDGLDNKSKKRKLSDDLGTLAIYSLKSHLDKRTLTELFTCICKKLVKFCRKKG